MKKSREIEFILYFIVLRVVLILSAIAFVPFIIEEILSIDDPLVKIASLAILIIIVFLIVSNNILTLIDYKKNKRIIKSTIQEIPPRMGIITDMLIYIHIIGNGADMDYHIKICPIVKDLGNKKLYVSFENLNIKILSSGPDAYAPMEYILRSLKGNEIKIGQRVNLHIKKEKRKILAYNKFVTINEIEYKYMGKISEFLLKDYNERALLFNDTSDNFLNELKELNIYEGIVDFDIYNKM